MTAGSKLAAALNQAEQTVSRIAQHSVIRNNSPFGAYVIESTGHFIARLLCAMPIILAMLIIAGLFIGVETLITSVQASAAMIAVWAANMHVIGGVIAVVYSIGASRYMPIDVADLLTRTMPSEFEHWEKLLAVSVAALLPMTYFAFLLIPARGTLGATVGISPYWVALGTSIGGFLAARQFFRKRYYRSRKTRAYTSAIGYMRIPCVVLTVYLAQIHFGYDLLLYGSPSQPMAAVFYCMLGTMVVVAWHLRIAVYEDAYGFPINPSIPLWSIVTRVPFVFAVFLLVFGAGLDDPFVKVFVTSPFVAAASYIAWRFWVTGDGCVPPYNHTNDGVWMSAPGRNVYEQRQQDHDDNATNVLTLRRAIDDLNAFTAAQSGSYTKIPQVDDRPALDEIETALDTVEMEVSGRLSGAARNEFHTKYQAVRQAVSAVKHA